MTTAQAKQIIAEKSALTVRNAEDNALFMAALKFLQGYFFKRQN